MTEFAPQHTEAEAAGRSSGKRRCYPCEQGRIQREDEGDASPSPTIFKHAFDQYNFSIILNLFDNNKPYALSTHNQKCTKTKGAIFGETLRFKCKNL